MNKGDDLDRVLIVEKLEKSEGKKRIVPSSSSSTSSIGKNSDVSGTSMEDSGYTEEVQSIFKSPLEAMEALEDVLPIRRGISRFYNGKSKSYGSLSEAIAIKDIGKAENGYMKRRRNLIACGIALDHNNRTYPGINNGGRGISKRIVTNTNGRRAAAAAAALAFALTNDEEEAINNNNNNIGSTLHHATNTRLDPLYEDTPSYGSSSSSFSSPPFRKFSPWRSFSMADLHQLPATIPVSLTSLEHISNGVTAPTK